MGGKVDYVRKHYGPQRARGLRDALAQRIGHEFPRLGGQRILELCADIILEVVQQHMAPRDHLCHGQVLWAAVAADAPPSRNSTKGRTPLVSVVLDLSTPDDITARIERIPIGQRTLRKALRLCQQAHAQGALLSNCDLAELLHLGDGRIGTLLSQHERECGTVAPRRATLHDMGTGVTHKRIICLKRYRDGLPPHLIAQQTQHGLDAVDRYLAAFERVRAFRELGMSTEQTAYFLGCGARLVREYLAILDEIEGKQP